MCIHIYTCVHIYVCICTYIYKEKKKYRHFLLYYDINWLNKLNRYSYCLYAL